MSNILVVIPTYNEKENIERIVAEIFRYISDINILIVDDNSSDGTATIANKMAKNDKRISVLNRTSCRGRGYAGVDAFKEAIKKKEVEYVIEMDADFSHDPKYIPIFLREIERNDVIIGSRFVKAGQDKERDLLRSFLTKVVNLFIRKYLKLNINDCSSGYRCFRKHVIASLDLDSIVSKGPAIIEETLYVLKLKNFKIKEVPIVFKRRHSGKTKLTLIKLVRVFMDILVFKKIYSKKAGKDMKEIRKFGFSLSLGLNILSFVMFYRAKSYFIWFTSIGVSVLVFAILYPWPLVIIKKILDFILSLIGRIINVISLTIVFYVIFTPLSILFRFLGKDTLDKKLDKKAKSYWLEKNKTQFFKKSYERMG